MSEGGRSVRKPLAAELVRLVDAVISSELLVLIIGPIMIAWPWS